MSKQDMGGPAFPAPDFAVSQETADEGLVMRLKNLQGMTLWDAYFIAAIGTVGYPRGNVHVDDAEVCAADAARLADAMLAERAKRQGDE